MNKKPVRPRRPRWCFRWWSWTALGVAVLVGGLALGLQPLARSATRRALDSVSGYTGSFQDVHVSLWPLRYHVTHLTEALAAKGFLTSKEPTPAQFLEGVKAFQRSRGLAATGYADHETLMRLGINPKDVDRSLGTPDAEAAKANGPAPTQ